METNRTPHYLASDNPTGCCPRFDPAGWDGQHLHFEDKLFARAKTHSLFHIPMDMGAVFGRTQAAIEAGQAQDIDQFIVLSHELSPWSAEHLFAVDRVVPGVEMTRLSGDFATRVFDGPFSDAPKWSAELRADLAARGEEASEVYFFYTTCPKCAKAYGHNYVVGVARLAEARAS